MNAYKGIQLFLQLKRLRKKLKRLRKKKNYRGVKPAVMKVIESRKLHDANLISKFSFPLNDFLEKADNGIKYKVNETIDILPDFSFETNFDQSYRIITSIRRSLFEALGQTLLLDFTKCIKTDFSALFILKIILNEYIVNIKKLQRNLTIYNIIPDIKIRWSKNSIVNAKLLANNIVSELNISEDINFRPVARLNMIYGNKKQKHYHENKKGKATTDIRGFINENLKRHDFELNADGNNFIDGIISEILNNAEDHGHLNKWYAFGNLFESDNIQNNNGQVAEINLAFMNFGNSIYQGFEETKVENKELYTIMETLYERSTSNTKLINRKFSKENLFTLFSLSDGFSRLKYKRIDRGTGTIKFISSFLELGNYEDKKNDIIPRLYIYSGKTRIKCDNEYKPFVKDGQRYLSLNDKNTLSLPPEASHIHKLATMFPGTLLVAKIYLNKNHLLKNIKNGK